MRDALDTSDDLLGLFRALPLAAALGLCGWALLAVGGYCIYLLLA